MLKYSLIITLLFNSWMAFAQVEEPEGLLKTDDTWVTEFFDFPLHFAPKLDYKGNEEACFPEGWGTEESPEFWSYAFVWYVNMDKDLSAYNLEEYIKTYFDGLMFYKNKHRKNNIRETNALFREKESRNGVTNFTGEVDVLDLFVTGDMLRLQVKVETSFCHQSQKAIVFFRFSPKAFTHNIWKRLDAIALQDNICNP